MFLALEMLLWTKVVYTPFQFLTPRIVEKISLRDILKALSSAAIVVMFFLLSLTCDSYMT